MKPARRRFFLHGVLYSVFVLFWMVVAAVTVEIRAHYCERRDAERLAREIAVRYETQRQLEVESLARDYPNPNPNLRQKLEPRTEFFRQGPHKLDFAAARRELVLECDQRGIVRQVFAGPLDSEVQRLAAHVKPGASFFDLLPVELHGDVWAAIGVAKSARGDAGNWRAYPLAFDGAPSNLYEFRFVVREDDAPGLLAIFILNSIWRESGAFFRGNGYSADFAGIDEVQTNAHGFRDAEVVLPRPADRYRIACVGGSTTAEGRRNALTYPKFLEKKLRAHFCTDKIEVLNCGVYGLNAAGELNILDRILALQPQLVLHYNFVNDGSADLMEAWSTDAMQHDPFAPLRGLASKSTAMWRYAPRFIAPDRAAVRASVHAQHIKCLEQMLQRVRQANAQLGVCSFAYPSLDMLGEAGRRFYNKQLANFGMQRVQIDGYAKMADIYNEEVRAFCTRNRLLYVPVMEGMNPREPVFTDICHMSTAGLDLHAQVVFDAIREYVGKQIASLPGAASQ